MRPEEIVDNGPIMTGTIELDGNRYSVSGFAKISEKNVRYLSLAIQKPLAKGFTAEEQAAQLSYYGKLFLQENKSRTNSPDYSGFIQVLANGNGVHHTNDEFDQAPRLMVTGFRRRNASDGEARIQLNIAPQLVDPNEVAF